MIDGAYHPMAGILTNHVPVVRNNFMSDRSAAVLTYPEGSRTLDVPARSTSPMTGGWT